MALEDIVKVTITKQTATVSRAGFGTPLIMSSEATSVLSETAKIYTGTAAMITDGFPADGAAVTAAGKIFSQNPKVSQIVVGQRALLPTMKIDLTPISFDLTLYRVLIGVTEFDYTSDAVTAGTVAEVTAGLTAALTQTAWITTNGYSVGDYVSANGNVYICTIAGTSGATAPSGTSSAEVDGTVTWAFKGPAVNVKGTDGTTKVTVEYDDGPGGVAAAWAGSTAYVVDDYVTNAGNVYRCSVAGTSAATGGPTGTAAAAIVDGTASWLFAGILNAPFALEADRSLLTRQDVTADPGVATDLASIRTALDGNDDWYAALLDTHGKAEIEALAAAIEQLSRIYLTSTADADVLTSATDDVASELQDSAYARTAVMWHEEPHNFPEAAWGGKLLPKDPGSVTWKFKTLAGIPISVLTVSEIANIEGKSANYYVEIAGNNITIEGWSSSGEFIDVTRGIDFIEARLKENVFLVLVNADKVPFTDAGIGIVENEVVGVMNLGVSQGIFAADPAPVVTAPKAADVDTADKANRLLPDVRFTATLAGAIHSVEIDGIVTV
jgi:hypothetical protein